MSALTLDTFFANHECAQLHEYATNLLSHFENYAVDDDIESNVNIEANNDVFHARQTFIDVYQIVKPGISQLTSKKAHIGIQSPVSSTSVVEDFTLSDHDVHMLHESLKTIKKHNWLSSNDANVANLTKITVLYISTALLLDVTKALIDSSLRSLEDISYYDNVLSKKYTVLLYFIQNLPIDIKDFVLHAKDIKFSASPNLIDIPKWIPHFLEETYTLVWKYAKISYSLLFQSVDNFIKSPTNFLMEKQHSSKSFFSKFWNSIFRLPYYYSQFNLESKRRNLVELQNGNISKIGYLLTNAPSFEIKKEELKVNFSVMNSLPGLFANSSSNEIEDSVDIETLCGLITDYIPGFKRSLLLVETANKKPSYLVRNWPIIVPSIIITVSYIPSTLRSVNLFVTDADARNECYEYFRSKTTFLVDTVYAFYTNWVINPINNILRTIRHDDKSKIALMSQQSLGSDLNSLERMVMDYLKDLNENVDDQAIKDAVRLGDLTLVMNNYEKDIRSPIKSIVTGDMLRNILIQIQKTKVDGSLALNGVDQILRSQELVFGFVAASPSLIILYNLKNSFTSWYNGTNSNSKKNLRTREIKTRMVRSLGKLEKILNCLATAEDIDYFSKGLLLIEIRNLKHLAVQLLPNFIFQDFQAEIDELVNEKLSLAYKLMAIQRLWNVYRGYIV